MNDERFLLANCQNTLVFGAGHGIGYALVKTLLETISDSQIIATYRLFHKAQDLISLSNKYPNRLVIYQLDPTEESEVENLSQNLAKEEVSFDLIINSVGFLENDDIAPEKSLRDIDKNNILKSFEINSIPSLFIAKHFEKKFRKDKTTCFVGISAKVGSIDDNALGGWYGYRASKAAMNMFLKNISIEFGRKKKKILTFAIHPGTTKTELSKNYIKNSSLTIHTPNETAKNILGVIDSSNIDENGSFRSWDGERIAW